MAQPNVSPVPNVKIPAQEPLDALAAAQMETIARRGRGFVLGLAHSMSAWRLKAGASRTSWPDSR